MKKIFSKYPANNYYSYSFAGNIAEFENSKFLKCLWVGNALAVTAMSILFIVITKKRCETYSVEAKSVDNYYLSKSLTGRIISAFEVLINICILGVALFIGRNVAICDVEFFIICVASIVLYAAVTFFHIKILIRGSEWDFVDYIY